jgi:anti-sigma factor RsiW
MTCDQIHELVPLYLSGELDPQRAAEFDAHLKGCTLCAGELESEARLDVKLREAFLAEELDTSRIYQRVRELIANERVTAANLTPLQAARRRRWVAAALGVAATLLLIAGGYVLVPRQVAQVYADAAEDHQTEVVDHRLRRWFFDRAQIDALAQGQGITAAVPAEVGAGYHLERARICRLDGLTYLHLVYGDGVREFSLFLRPRDAVKLNAPIRGFANGRLLRECVSGNEHLSSFATQRLSAVVVTDQSAVAALRFARAISAAI